MELYFKIKTVLLIGNCVLSAVSLGIVGAAWIGRIIHNRKLKKSTDEVLFLCVLQSCSLTVGKGASPLERTKRSFYLYLHLERYFFSMWAVYGELETWALCSELK